MTEASKHLAKVGTEKGEILFSNRNQSRKVHIIYIVLPIKNFVKFDFLNKIVIFLIIFRWYCIIVL